MEGILPECDVFTIGRGTVAIIGGMLIVESRENKTEQFRAQRRFLSRVSREAARESSLDDSK
jgi:hypothetical protein